MCDFGSIKKDDRVKIICEDCEHFNKNGTVVDTGLTIVVVKPDGPNDFTNRARGYSWGDIQRCQPDTP